MFFSDGTCEKPPATELSQRRDTDGRLIGVGIFVLAVTVRLLYLYESSANPSFMFPIVDSEVYDDAARQLASKGLVGGTFFWQPFFYPFFLSVVYFVGSSSILFAKIVQVLLGGVTCLLTYRLGKRIFGQTVGIIAGLITAFYGPLVFFETELLGSGWAAFWSVALILLFLMNLSERSLRLCAILGVCGALSILTRPTFALFFAAGVVWLIVACYRAGNKWDQIIPRIGGILVGFLLVVVPVAVTNFGVTRHFGFLPASGGVNLYIGNNPNRSDTLTARPGWAWDEIVELPERHGVTEDMWAKQDFFKQKVTQYIRTDPGGFAKGLAHKSVQFVNSREIPRNVNVYVMRKWSWVLSVLAWKVGGFGFPFGVLLPLAILGLVVGWRRVPGPMLLFLIFYPLSIVLIFVTARYRVPVVPAMAILASAGLISLIRMVRTARQDRLTVVGVCALAVILLASLPGPFPEEKPNYEAELYGNVGAVAYPRGQIKAAYTSLRKALQLMPDYPSAHGNMGAVLTAMRKPAEALEHYQKALAYKEDSPEVHNNLASALASLGKIDQAHEHFVRALEIKPRYPKALYNLGRLQMQQKNFDDAIVHLKKAVRIKPDYTKAHLNLAEAYVGAGRFAEAEAAAEKALELAKSSGRNNLAFRIQNRLASYRAKARAAEHQPAASSKPATLPADD